jgi:hypothetical protein
VGKYHPPTVNLVAKVIREELTVVVEGDLSHSYKVLSADVATKIALNFARRFAKDNHDFNPLKFLDQCSPNPQLYPLSELWEVAGGNNST